MLHVYTHMCVHAHAHTHTHTRTHTCARCTCTCVLFMCMHACMHACTHVHMCPHVAVTLIYRGACFNASYMRAAHVSYSYYRSQSSSARTHECACAHVMHCVHVHRM